MASLPPPSPVNNATFNNVNSRAAPAQPVKQVHGNSYITMTNLLATALTSSFVYGPFYDLSNWTNAMLELSGTGITGSITGLQAEVQLLSPVTGTFYKAPLTALNDTIAGTAFANPTTAIATVPTGTNILAAYMITSPLFGVAQIGLASTAAGTAGSVAATLHLWK